MPAKDILLYGYIGQYSAMFFFEQLDKALEKNATADMTFRITSEGGEPEYGWAIITKLQELQELENVKKILVDGCAHSMAAWALCYVDEREAVDTAQFLLHRAAYSDYLETNPNFFTEIVEKNLVDINAKLQKAFFATVDIDKFEALPQCKEKGIKAKDIFSMDGRVEVLLTASDAKSIGLIDSIRKITPTKKAQITANLKLFGDITTPSAYKAAAVKLAKHKPSDEPDPIEDDPTPTVMTLEELKTKHPDIYAQAIASGATTAKSTAVAEEQERVSGWMEFNEIDPEAVKKGIASGKPLSMKDIAEFTRKGISASKVTAVKKDAAGNVITEATPAGAGADPEKVKKVAAFEKEVFANLGIKEEKAA